MTKILRILASRNFLSHLPPPILPARAPPCLEEGAMAAGFHMVQSWFGLCVGLWGILSRGE